MEPLQEPATLAEFVMMLETHIFSRGWVKNPHWDVPRRYEKVTGSRGDFEITSELTIPENYRLGPSTYGGSKHDVALLSGFYQNRSADIELIWKFGARSFPDSPDRVPAEIQVYQCFKLGRGVGLCASFATFHEFYEHMLAQIDEKGQLRK
jgi:hypothetical protein